MKKEFIPYLLALVPLAPLLAAIANALIFAYANRKQKEAVQYWTILISIAATCIALGAHFSVAQLHQPLISEGSATVLTPAKWLVLGVMRLDWGMRFDALTFIMVPVVLFVALMVQVFSIGYLHDRKYDYARYFSLLSFFVFSMLLLVVASNLFVFFVGWEAVGLSSYKLISFYIEKEAAQRAGKKAFIMNRIGDAALLLGAFAIFRVANTADFREIALVFSKGGIATTHANFIGLMIFIGAAAKSAQLPLYTWLPDAMTGPTPVSALIHAATMVTAGIFLMLRLEPVFLVAPDASQLVAFAGATTAFIAAFIAVCQTDIKKVLAFSTVSQLGLMVLAVGTGSFAAAFFHLFTHAFFKAMLFLSAGAVITYTHHEQNIRHMGGLGRERPLLALIFWIGLAALAGLPGLSGFFSKDHILAAAFAAKSGGLILCALAILTSLLTAFYSFRLGIIVFHGKPAATQASDNHDHGEPSVSFYLPLLALLVPAMFAGWIGVPSFFTGYQSRFMEFVTRNFPVAFTAAQPSHHAEMIIVSLGVAVALGGALAAITYYGILGRRPVAEGAFRHALSRLSLNKLYVDEVYQSMFVNPYRQLAAKFADWDVRIIPAISNGIAYFVQAIGGALARLQNGILAHYAIYMFAGVALLLFIAMGVF